MARMRPPADLCDLCVKIRFRVGFNREWTRMNTNQTKASFLQEAAEETEENPKS